MPDEELDNLLRENREIINALSEVTIQQGKERKDELKVLFTLIHRDITQEIIRAVGLEAFDNPKSLLRFNKHFANAYLQAIKNPASSPKWKKAFDECEFQSGIVRQALADWASNDPAASSPLVTQMLPAAMHRSRGRRPYQQRHDGGAHRDTGKRQLPCVDA